MVFSLKRSLFKNKIFFITSFSIFWQISEPRLLRDMKAHRCILEAPEYPRSHNARHTILKSYKEINWLVLINKPKFAREVPMLARVELRTIEFFFIVMPVTWIAMPLWRHNGFGVTSATLITEIILANIICKLCLLVSNSIYHIPEYTSSQFLKKYVAE